MTLTRTEYIDEFLKDDMDRDAYNPFEDEPPARPEDLVEVKTCGAQSDYAHECGEVDKHDGNHVCCLEDPDNPDDLFAVCGYEWKEGEE